MTDGLVRLILRCTREVAEREDVPLPDHLDRDTILFGQEGFFDSLGLVDLILVFEETVEEEYGVVVTLADERAMSRSTSPFRSVGSLAEYAERLVEEAR